MKTPNKNAPCQRLLLPFAAVLAVAAACSSQAVSYHETVLADKPAAYYRLEEPAGSFTITNAVNPDAYQGTVIYDDYGVWPKFQQAGVGSNSVSFHLYTPEGGTAQKSHIEVPYAAELNPEGPFTAECWARVTSWGSVVRCIVGNVGDFSHGWWFRQEAGTTPRWLWVQNGGGIYMAGGSITKNEWAHLVVTYDGTKSYFYANGKQEWSSGGIPAPNSGGPLSIGGTPVLSEEFFDGSVDEVAVYTNSLTADQIKLHYEVGRTNIAIPPVPASVVTDPVPASAFAGRTATFGVTASGTTPLSYQWYRDSTPISGANSDVLNFTCAYADNGVAYKVVVTNLYGAATSAPAVLTVMTDLTLDSSPLSISRNVGSKAAFIAVPGGALPVTYKWFKGATEIPGATNEVLWLSNVQLTDDQTTYYARITNPWMSTNSEPATLTVVPRAITVPVTGYAKVVMADDPVAFWRLDEPENSITAVDAAGSFDGSYTAGAGAITYGVATGIPHETDKAAAVTGKANIQIPWALELNPHGPFSAEFWFQPASLNPGPDFRNVFSSEGTLQNGPHGWLLYQMPDNTLVWVLFSHNWGGAWLGDATVVQANAWYHIVLTFDGAVFHSYLNGNDSASVAYTDYIPNGDGWTSFGFRYDGNGTGFDGAIDDVAFYNKTLTAEQVQAHYLATVRLGFTKSGNNLILSWPFGTLQQADQAGGAYSDMPTATSPYTAAIGATPKFFRVKVQ